MSLAPLPIVNGAARNPLPYGLFSVFSAREDSADRWEVGGVIWETLTCEPLGGLGGPKCLPETTLGLPRSLEKLSEPDGEALSFAVYGHFTCSPVGNSLETAYQKAVDHLLLREEARVEQALWTGDLGNVPNFAGANGYAAPTAIGAFTDAWLAVSTLEQQFAEVNGSQGVLHMSRRTVSWLMKHGEIVSRGGKLFTGLGTPVVAGTGYGDDKIVMSGQLFGYKSEVYPGQEPVVEGNFLNRQNNDLKALAERAYLIGFDECGLMEASITIESGGGTAALAARVDTLETEVGTLETEVAGKANTAHTHAAGDTISGVFDVARVPELPTSQITGLDAALDSKVESVQPGTGIAVDSTDPKNPIVATA